MSSYPRTAAIWGVGPLIVFWVVAAGAAQSPAQERNEQRPRLVVQMDHNVKDWALSPVGGRLVTASYDSSVRVVDAVSGREVVRLEGHHGGISSVAFSPDGMQVVSGAGKSVLSGTGKLEESGEARVWDTVNRSVLVELRHPATVNSVMFSPDGKRVLTASDKIARVWDAASGKELALLRHDRWINSAVFSPDGKRVLTREGILRTARVWDATTGKELAVLKGDIDPSPSAFSPDGKCVLTRSEDRVARVWDAATGKELTALGPPLAAPRFITKTLPRGGKKLEREIDKRQAKSAQFSLDGKRVVTGSEDGIARVWDAATGKELAALKGHTRPVLRAMFSPDGKQVVTGSLDGTARVWDVAAAKKLAVLRGHTLGVARAEFSRDGKWVVTSSHDGTVRVWDAGGGQELSSLQGHSVRIWSASFSPTQRRVCIGLEDSTARVWDVASGRVSILRGHTKAVRSAVFSKDEDRVATASSDGTARVWHSATAELQAVLKGHAEAVTRIAFSPNGAQLVTGSEDGTTRVWEAGTGKLLTTLQGKPDLSWVQGGLRGGKPPPVESAAFSSDGTRVIAALQDGTVRLWDTQTSRELVVLGGRSKGFFDTRLAQLSLGGGRVLTKGPDGKTIHVSDVTTGEKLPVLKGHTGLIAAARFSANGKRVVTGSEDGTVRVWDVDTRRELASFRGHPHSVRSVSFGSEGTRVVVQSMDRSARVWDVETGRMLAPFKSHELDAEGDTVGVWDTESGKALCRFVCFRDGGWALTTPEGRFDSNDLDLVKGFHWVAPDEPFQPLPPEIFMRDYYEPRLLARLLAGEVFKPIRSLADLNRVQPSVEAKKIEAQPGHPDEVVVTVEVAEQSRTSTRGGKPVRLKSGVHDLHLFRDGQLVGRHPSEDGEVRLDPKTSRATLRFEHIRLPRRAGQKEVEFSAYAFNADRVKSQTHRLKFPLPADLTPRKGTAYLVCVGVNAFDSTAWDLRFAVPDARSIAHSLRDTLTHSGQFERVVEIPFLSDSRSEKGKRTFAENTATKDNVRAVLALLAGQKIDDARLKQIPDAAKVRQARPEDLVLLSFSTHGYNGTDGRFYLFPSDIGPGHDRVTDALLRRAVSTDELSLWLRGVDAGEMVMIVDACHSAGTVEQDGFKPGPMGSRGLGQLAYNKRMRILAASQASDVAFEHAQIGHGLLTYALCQNGLKEGRADFAPADRKVMLGEWLRYGVQRVPQLAEEIAAGKERGVSGIGRDLRVGGAERDMIFRQGRRSIAQQPSLFDFTRGGDGVLLQELAPSKKERE